MKEFKDKVLVVTGGSRGIGKAIAVEGAKRGMKIVLNDIDGDQLAKTCEEIKGMGVECIGQHADISLYENIEALLKLAMDSFGHVVLLVNNAGCAVSGAIWKLPKQDIDWITELNFLSHLYGMKIFLPQMIANPRPPRQCIGDRDGTGSQLLCDVRHAHILFHNRPPSHRSSIICRANDARQNYSSV